MSISRRVIVLSIVVLLAVVILAAVVGYFTVMHTQAAPGSGQPVPSGYSIGQVSVKLNTASLPLAVKPSDDNCMAVPSWDLTQRGLEGKGSDLLQLYFKLESKDVS